MMRILLSANRLAPLWLMLVVTAGISSSVLAQSQSSYISPVEARLQERLRENANDSGTWRLLGRVRLQRGDASGAYEACRRAVDLDPSRVSAHFDLARSLLALNQPEQAAFHFSQVVSLASESEYAQHAISYLRDLPAPAQPPEVTSVSYEFEPNRFGGIGVPEPSALKPHRFDFRLETGMLYNSNVQMAPLSREIFPGDPAGFQGFLSPQLEWRFLTSEVWTAGVTFDSYFNLNEGNQQRFNLQNYQPGMFFERVLGGEEVEWFSRVEYDFTHDAFEGNPFGQRHGLTTSLNALRDDGSLSVLYWRIDHTDFASDGATPSVTSLDGWTNTLGVRHEFDPLLGPMDLFRIGADVQWADLQGSNFAYQGVYLYSEAEVSLFCHTWLELQLGWGYRDYFAFQLSPSRNENIWRAALELHQALSEHWTVTGLFSYDRFASANTFFDSDRFLAGIMLTFTR